MTDRPIIFSAPMVKALLAGRKTQARRIIKPQPVLLSEASLHSSYAWRGGFFALRRYPSNSTIIEHLPYAISDRLWVRETWAVGIRYAATDERVGIKDRASTQMPRWASRLTLDVTDVRVQRLQDISEEDAIAEGMIHRLPTAEEIAAHKQWCEDSDGEYVFDPVADARGLWYAPGSRRGFGLTKTDRDKVRWAPTAACAFRFTWESIHGAEALVANPWVAALTFTVRHGNIDAAVSP